MKCEFLPATTHPQQELVLLHGWGSDLEVWRPLLALLRPWANVTLLDIPGCAPGCSASKVPALADTLEAILGCCPQQAVFVGWSLGGQLAVELAMHAPERVLGVATVCSNPQFVASANWPGMAADDFEEFRATVQADVTRALQRFNALQVSGSSGSRQLLRALRPQGEIAATTVQPGLQWLGSLDQRNKLATLKQPQHHILAQHDVLVPALLQNSLGQLLAATRCASVELVSGVGHVLPLEAPAQLAASLRNFLATRGLLQGGTPAQSPRAKREVAASFSRAAREYDSVAHLQRDVGAQLLSRLDLSALSPRRVLDLGCGTGFIRSELKNRFPSADYIGLDIAAGMVDFARSRGGAGDTWLVADAESLPLSAESQDVVYSSLAVQWCDRPHHLFAELARVLRPGGYCVFSTLGPDTLRELRAAWATVDAGPHVNTFVPVSELFAAARGLPRVTLELEQHLFRLEYARARDLLAELKALGAHNMHRERTVGLTSRRALQRMLGAYEAHRRDGVLPASYDVVFGVLRKT